MNQNINSPKRKLRCVVVDDSTIYRKVVRDVLGSLSDVEVVGVANDGIQALDRIKSYKPDLVTLDLEMPNLDGIGVLRELDSQNIDVGAIMLSAFTKRGAQTTTTALSLGAFDFILKPNTTSMEESVRELKSDLEPKIAAYRLRKGLTKPQVAPKPISRPTQAVVPTSSNICKPNVVVIGVSTGGPQALVNLLPKIPGSFPVPILVVQHMPAMFTKSLADDLNGRCQLNVHEACDGQTVKAGNVYIAPGGKQMRLGGSNLFPLIDITNDAPERNCRPAVDYLFRSTVQMFGAKTLGVILTGMGDDGTIGSGLIHQAGGSVIAQDEASCVVYGMPRSVAEKGYVNRVAPLNQIPEILAAAACGKNLSAV